MIVISYLVQIVEKAKTLPTSHFVQNKTLSKYHHSTSQRGKNHKLSETRPGEMPTCGLLRLE
jgi:hypothetical protein